MKKLKITKHILSGFASVLFLATILSSCLKTFDYSVYSAYVPAEYRDTRELNLNRLSNSYVSDTVNCNHLTVALISDPHSDYDDLQEAVYSINDRDDIDLIMVGGDIADGGMLDEFLLFRHVMEKAKLPYFTVIGNHDCLANGYAIYEEMFGSDDYILRVANCKFVFFNDVVWELNNREPDFFWLFGEILNKGTADHVFVVTHIPPYSDSFSPLQQYAYVSMMDSAKVAISISGHLHHYYYGDYYDNGSKYMTIGSADKRYWVKLSIVQDSINVERIPF